MGAAGTITRSAAVKALSTWVDHGVLKEDPENTFVLLERAEEGGAVREPRTSLLIYSSWRATLAYTLPLFL